MSTTLSKKMEEWFLNTYIAPLKYLEFRDDNLLFTKALCNSAY